MGNFPPTHHFYRWLNISAHYFKSPPLPTPLFFMDLLLATSSCTVHVPPAHLPATTASPCSASMEERVAASVVQLEVVMYPEMVLHK